jgi:hypothetical protein
VVDDARMGPVRLTGELRAPAGARALVVIVHGLGGSPRSSYCLRAARVAWERGLASLCLALRGADRRGEDFYNVGLRADLCAALASPALAPYPRLYLLGYSMGGFVVLHAARGPLDARVQRVAAISTPLDLQAAQRHVDSPRAWLYRRHVLGGLKEIYRAVAERGRAVPTPLSEVLAVRTIHAWDRLTIAPRYGFASPEAYYAALALAPHLARLEVPALLVAGSRDPVIPADTIRPFLPAAGEGLLTLWVEDAGHVAFPRDLDLGLGGEPGLEPQVLAWLAGTAAGSGASEPRHLP